MRVPHDLFSVSPSSALLFHAYFTDIHLCLPLSLFLEYSEFQDWLRNITSTSMTQSLPVGSLDKEFQSIRKAMSAMQCSMFGVWGSRTKNGNLVWELFLSTPSTVCVCVRPVCFLFLVVHFPHFFVARCLFEQCSRSFFSVGLTG